MTGFSSVHNGGANARSARGSGGLTATAGGAGDNTVANANWVSRKDDRNKGIALSVKLIVSYSAVLAAAATLKFAVNFQDATDGAGTGAAQYPVGESVATTTAAIGPAGGGTVSGTFEVDMDLAGAREFIRAQVTPDLSAGATDTLSFHMDYVFFGEQRGPTTKSPVNLGSPDLI